MEEPKLENKPYKKIVPLRGKFAAKLRNEFKKELSKNDCKTAENGVNDSINNNFEAKELPTVKEPLKPATENKIIIQKVENVHIDVIPLLKGPPRRISSLFPKQPLEMSQSSVEEESFQPSSNENDAIAETVTEQKPLDSNNSKTLETDIAKTMEIDMSKPLNCDSSTPQSTVTILSTKMPDNSFNKAVPLKMVRVIKQPKPKPNLRHRVHRVETFEEIKPQPVLEPEPVYDFSSIKIEVLVPNIEMKDELDFIDEVHSTQTNESNEVCNVNSLQVQETHKKPGSDSEEDLLGFDTKTEVKNLKSLEWLKVFQCPKITSDQAEDIFSKVPSVSSTIEDFLEVTSEAKSSASSQSVDSSEKEAEVESLQMIAHFGTSTLTEKAKEKYVKKTKRTKIQTLLRKPRSLKKPLKVNPEETKDKEVRKLEIKSVKDTQINPALVPSPLKSPLKPSAIQTKNVNISPKSPSKDIKLPSSVKAPTIQQVMEVEENKASAVSLKTIKVYQAHIQNTTQERTHEEKIAVAENQIKISAKPPVNVRDQIYTSTPKVQHQLPPSFSKPVVIELIKPSTSKQAQSQELPMQQVMKAEENKVPAHCMKTLKVYQAHVPSKPQEKKDDQKVSVLENHDKISAKAPVNVRNTSIPTAQHERFYIPPKTVEIHLIKPSTSKQAKIQEVKKVETKAFLKSIDSKWQEDILAVIGASRIAEIDKTLEDIPYIVTGNAIETENVEQKLIINHLLRLLKVKTIMESVKLAKPSTFNDHFKDSTDDDDDDDFPDSFDDHSNDLSDFNPTEGDMSASGYEDNLRDNNNSNKPGPSHSCASENNSTFSKLIDTPAFVDPVQNITQSQENSVVLENSCHPNVNVTQEKISPSINDHMLEPPAIQDTLPNCQPNINVTQEEMSPSVRDPILESPTIQDTLPGMEVDKSIKETSRKRKSVSPQTSQIPEKRRARNTRLPWKLLLDGNARRGSLRSQGSSRETSVEPPIPTASSTPIVSEKNQKRLSILSSSSLEKNSPLVSTHSPLLDGNERQISTRSRGSSCDSTLAVHKSESLQKKVASTDSDTEPIHNLRGKKRVKQLLTSTDESERDDVKENTMLRSSSCDSDAPLARIGKSNIYQKVPKKRPICKMISSSSESNEKTNTHRNHELESRLASSDSNSKYTSSILIRNDYLQSTDKKREKQTPEIVNMMDRLIKTIEKKKLVDPTYVTPPQIQKRERLRTSAFKGNDECSNDEDIPDTEEPSVSRELSVSREPSADSTPNIKDRMKELIDQEKSKQTPENSASKKRLGRPQKLIPELSEGFVKKIFVQEPLKAAIENRVPYDDILQLIKVSIPPKKRGRTTKNDLKEYEEKKQQMLKELQAEKYFRCGSCNFLVTKHKWLDHFYAHGAIAWIDGFEPPIELHNWNEAVRRTVNSFKCFEIVSIKCPHCQLEKRSALGHLSHYFICGETLEVIESRKITCELCNEKILPFNASLHKTKCSGNKRKQVVDDDGDDEEEESSDEDSKEDYSFSGRHKRKAVKRAEKKFKKIIDTLNDPSDNLRIVDGNIKCRICGKADFDSQEIAIKHIQENHDMGHNDGDFEGDSESDDQQGDDESDETEGSSGVESSDLEGSEEEDDEEQDMSKLFSSKKGRKSLTESQEVKNGRALITEYVESFNGTSISTMTIKWTQQFVDENWNTEVLAHLQPQFNLSLAKDLKPTLTSLKFSLKSIKFGTQRISSYESTEYKKPWKQLELCEQSYDENSMTIYCGGSVASIDWAPASGELNFLAVSCNSAKHGIEMNLTETSQSCVQIYEFKNLKNHKFKQFSDNAKLCYVIIVNNGPVLSIKFHPSESPLEKRIGLLAVATANQKVLIYSLPYLNNDKSIVLPLKPLLVCKLENENMFFNKEYLLQVTKISWFHTKNCGSILSAGYINGLVAVWNVNNHEGGVSTLYPLHVIQAHVEPITGLDFKATPGSEYYLLTAAMDRNLNVFRFDDTEYQEVASQYATSRIFCAEWWMHWPGYLVGLDDCFSIASISYQQPLDFGSKRVALLSLDTSVIDLNINHWLNHAMFTTEGGDVIGCNPNQLISTWPKDKWSYYRFNVFSSTTCTTITSNGCEEIGVVFSDFQDKIRQPKRFRLAPTDRINELQINQVCFNRNESSYRFYALGFETGFVRIKYLKNFK